MPLCRQTWSRACGEARLSFDQYVWQCSSTFHIGWALIETGSGRRGADHPGNRRPTAGGRPRRTARWDPAEGSEEDQARQQRQRDDGLQDGLGLHARHDDLSIAVVAEEAAPARLQRLAHTTTADERIPIDVVIEVAGEEGPRDHRRF